MYAIRHCAAVITVAAMFAVWLPLFHAGRIAADTTSAFEWQFASMALALSGALLLLGTRSYYTGSSSIDRR